MNLNTVKLNNDQKIILEFLEKFQVCEAKQIENIFNISPSAAINRMKTLERKGYIISFRKLVELNTCYKLSKKGKDFTNPQNTSLYQPTNGTIKHYVLISSLASILMKKGAFLDNLISDKELMKINPNEHRPDLVLINGEKKIAFEVELTAKNKNRLSKNIFSNNRNYDKQIWIPGRRYVLNQIKNFKSQYPKINLTIMDIEQFF